jgi:hypothetical protein
MRAGRSSPTSKPLMQALRIKHASKDKMNVAGMLHDVAREELGAACAPVDTGEAQVADLPTHWKFQFTQELSKEEQARFALSARCWLAEEQLKEGMPSAATKSFAAVLAVSTGHGGAQEGAQEGLERCRRAKDRWVNQVGNSPDFDVSATASEPVEDTSGWLPRTFVQYTLRIAPRCGVEWELQSRFSEFLAVRDLLVACGQIGADARDLALPPRTRLSASAADVAERAAALPLFVHRLLRDHDEQPCVRQFLRLDERRSALLIQLVCRTLLPGMQLAQRREAHQAAVVLQSLALRNALRRQFEIFRSSRRKFTTLIQSSYRSLACRKQWAAIRCAALLIQSKQRARRQRTISRCKERVAAMTISCNDNDARSVNAAVNAITIAIEEAGPLCSNPCTKLVQL